MALARRALSIGGEGHWFFSLGINLTVTTNVDAEMRALTQSGLVTTIIKSTSVRAIVSQGPSADRGRGMVPISDGAVAVIGGAPGLTVTVGAFAGLCQLVYNLFGGEYGYHQPAALVSVPRAVQQCSRIDDPPRLLGALTAAGPNTRLRLWPDSHRAVRAGSTTVGGRGVLIDVRPYDYLVLRGDAVLCGVRNSSHLSHCRLHVYFIAAGHEASVDLDATHPLPHWAGPRRERNW